MDIPLTSRDLLVQIAEVDPEGILLVDAEGCIVFANAAAEAILGVARDRIVGARVDAPFSNFTAADGTALAPEANPLLRVLAYGRPVCDVDIGYARADGEKRILAVNVAPLRGPSGEIVAVVTSFRDVTEQRKILSDPREVVERYRLIGRATNDAIWDWGLSRDEVTFNETMYTMFGYTAEEVDVGNDWLTRHIHPDDRARVTEGIRAALESGAESWSDEYRILRGDGSYATVLDRGYIARDERGRPVRMIGSILDITEKKQAEERQRLLDEASRALAVSLDYEEMLATLIRLAVPAIADYCVVDILDEDGGFQRAYIAHRDPELERLAREMLGRYPAGPYRRSKITEVVNSGRAEFVSEVPPGHLDEVAEDEEHLRVLRRLGIRSVMLVPLTARGRALGVISLVAGESGRRYGPDDLSLAQDLAARAALMLDNARLYREAQQASRAKSDFLAVMSHEFRTPLTAIIGYAELLDSEVLGPLNPDQKSKLGHIRASAWHVSGLVEEILAYARLEAGQMKIENERVDIAALVDDVIALVQPATEGREITMAAHVPDELSTLPTDAGKLRQILLNLLSNAVKFTDSGRIEVTVRLDGDVLVFEVTDTGIGVEREHLAHLFDPFWQVDQSPTRRVGGAGLGLSVTRRLARLLGGDVMVESTPGQGSMFRVWVRAQPAQRDAETVLVADG